MLNALIQLRANLWGCKRPFHVPIYYVQAGARVYVCARVCVRVRACAKVQARATSKRQQRPFAPRLTTPVAYCSQNIYTSKKIFFGILINLFVRLTMEVVLIYYSAVLFSFKNVRKWHKTGVCRLTIEKIRF